MRRLEQVMDCDRRVDAVEFEMRGKEVSMNSAGSYRGMLFMWSRIRWRQGLWSHTTGIVPPSKPRQARPRVRQSCVGNVGHTLAFPISFRSTGRPYSWGILLEACFLQRFTNTSARAEACMTCFFRHAHCAVYAGRGNIPLASAQVSLSASLAPLNGFGRAEFHSGRPAL